MRFLQRLILGLALVCVHLTVHAQDRVIEEIVVTATKRDTTVMDVAASVTAFTAEQLAEREIESVLEDRKTVV